MRGEQQMHVVGHEDAGVDLAALAPGSIRQKYQISQVVRFGKKAGLVVLIVLHNVRKHIVELNAWESGDRSILVIQFEHAPFFKEFGTVFFGYEILTPSKHELVKAWCYRFQQLML